MMQIKPACFGAVFGITAGVACGAPPEELYEQGLAMYERGQYRAALAAISRAGALGHVRSQEMTGPMHLAGPALYGDQVPRDSTAGRAWLARAAEEGCEMARRFVCASGEARSAGCAAPAQASTGGTFR